MSVLSVSPLMDCIWFLYCHKQRYYCCCITSNIAKIASISCFLWFFFYCQTFCAYLCFSQNPCRALITPWMWMGVLRGVKKRGSSYSYSKLVNGHDLSTDATTTAVLSEVEDVSLVKRRAKSSTKGKSLVNHKEYPASLQIGDGSSPPAPIGSLTQSPTGSKEIWLISVWKACPITFQFF